MTVIVAGKVLPATKHVWASLLVIYGIGKTRAIEVCKKADVNIETIVDKLDQDQLERIRKVIGNYVTESDLRRQQSVHIKTLQAIGCYRGIRRRRGLPCRGQRTRTNAKTAKGKRNKSKT